MGRVSVEQYDARDVESSTLNADTHEPAIVVTTTTIDELSIRFGSRKDRQDFDDALADLIKACR